MLAFKAKRLGEQYFCYVILTAQDSELTKRDRTLKQALDKMNENRKKLKPVKLKVSEFHEEYDFEDIHSRIKMLKLDASATNLFWTAESKKILLI
ncbi:MAG: hypothetical protein MK132_18550 [Lentisphaerales bacterium]|nr:hypothetical protein [Lentisphaerales bacterium]